MSSTIPPSNGTHLKFIADQFARGFQELRDAVNNIQTQVQAGAIDMAAVKADMSNLQDKVEDLKKLVHGSNGNSLTTKLITIENELKIINKWIDGQKEKKTESTKNKVQVTVALITGIFALIASIVGPILQYLGH